MRKLISFSLALVFGATLLSLDTNANTDKFTTLTTNEINANAGSPMSAVFQKERRRRRRSIGSAYKRGGKSAARGGKRFGKNMYRGKPVVASRELGKGAGGLGKGVGQGTARTGKKVGRTTKNGVKNVGSRIKRAVS